MDPVFGLEGDVRVDAFGWVDSMFVWVRRLVAGALLTVRNLGDWTNTARVRV